MSEMFDAETKKKMLQNAGLPADRIGKYVNESKKPAPVAKKPEATKPAATKTIQVKKNETLAQMKENFKKEMLKMLDEAFDPMQKQEEDPMAGLDAGAPAGVDPGLDAGADLGATPDLGADAGLGAGDDLGLGGEGDPSMGGDSESLKTEIKDKFSELATKLGEEEKNTFANELMEILFPGSTTEISGEGGEGDLGVGAAPELGAGPDAGLGGAPELGAGEEDDELDDDELL